jgi:hypothetical protein
MIDWEKEMDAASQRDDQLLEDRTTRTLADLNLRSAGHAAAPAPMPDAALETSLYEQAIAAAAARRGVSPQTIMDEDYQQLSYSSYPTPECLTPDELESIYLTDPASLPAWAKDRLRHVDACQPCRRLFASMHPDAESHKRFKQALEKALAEEAVAVAAPTNLLNRFRQVAAAAAARIRVGSWR